MNNWYADTTALEKTTQSYLDAMRQVRCLCPKLSVTCNESNSGALLPCAFDLPAQTDPFPLMHYLHYAHAGHQQLYSLMSHRPEYITEQHPVWHSDYFTVSLRFAFPFDRYYWQDESVETTGASGQRLKKPRVIPGQYASQSRAITLHWTHYVPLRHWRMERPRLERLASAMPVALLNVYRPALDRADKDVAAWVEAVRSYSNHLAPLADQLAGKGVE